MLERKLATSEHVTNLVALDHPTLDTMPANICCLQCKQSCTKGALYKWLSGPCRPVELSGSGDDEVAKPIWGSPVQVGNKELDQSHSLRFYKGVWWCLKCGNYTTIGVKASNPKLLKDKCSGVATSYGLNCLNRLKRGLSPHSHRDWPVQAIVVKKECRYRLRTKSKVKKVVITKNTKPEYCEPNDPGQGREQENEQNTNSHNQEDEEEESNLYWIFSLDGEDF